MVYTSLVLLVATISILIYENEAASMKLSFLVGDFNASNIPGTPGKDYPILRDIPEVNFECTGLSAGIYADYETRCQVFHMCDDDTRRFTFLCPNGTVFNEKRLKCDWWNKVSCKSAHSLVNLLFPIKGGAKGKTLPRGGQPIAQDRTLDLVDGISDLIKSARRRQNVDVDEEEEGGSRFREIARKVLRILTSGL